MKRYASLAAALLLIPALSTPAIAQQADAGNAKPATAADSTGTATAKARPNLLRTIEIQNLRPADQRGINIFEAPKDDGVPFEGFKLSFGAAFTQQFQGLHHSNTATPNVVSNVDQNKLMTISNGFNNATANLNVNAQLAPGIRVALTSYLSAKHHQETWVKDGYLMIDQSPIDKPILNSLMKVVTLKLGHFEINYGDAHFRRSDNGNAIYNPFVGNYIMDAFTTEIGAEVYLRKSGMLAMGGITGGLIRGQVTAPAQRAPSYIGKLGFDRQFTPDLRARLTGSIYSNYKSASNTLYTGDRAGARYDLVIENTAASTTSAAWSGNLRSGLNLSNKVQAVVVNPFIKFRGLELFGNIEQAKGRSATETASRTWNQYAGDVVYRLLDDKLFVGGRYNTVSGKLAGNGTPEVSIDRTAFSAGWFVTPVMLLKGEWVNQKYNDFPAADIRNGGKFKGFMVEAVVAF